MGCPQTFKGDPISLGRSSIISASPESFRRRGRSRTRRFVIDSIVPNHVISYVMNSAR